LLQYKPFTEPLIKFLHIKQKAKHKKINKDNDKFMLNKYMKSTSYLKNAVF
jgi:hypothetical protein